MESDSIKLEPLVSLVYTVKEGGTVRRFLRYWGAKRTNERKTNGVWYVDLKVLDAKKWILAKLKYGLI